MTYNFKIIKVISGQAVDNLSITIRTDSEHKSNNYKNHSDPDFWNNDIGRSEFHTGMCRPSHTFATGYQYLLFADRLAAIKSAEIISDTTDKWLNYVLNKSS